MVRRVFFAWCIGRDSFGAKCAKENGCRWSSAALGRALCCHCRRFFPLFPIINDEKRDRLGRERSKWWVVPGGGATSRALRDKNGEKIDQDACCQLINNRPTVRDLSDFFFQFFFLLCLSSLSSVEFPEGIMTRYWYDQNSLLKLNRWRCKKRPRNLIGWTRTKISLPIGRQIFRLWNSLANQ